MYSADYAKELEAENVSLRAALGDAKAEAERLRAKVGELQSILIDNTHALRTVLHGHSGAMACTRKEAWELTLAEVVAAKAEAAAARQALWDVYGILGFDQDGDPTPDALVHPPLIDVVIAAATEFRADYQEAVDAADIPASLRAEAAALRDALALCAEPCTCDWWSIDMVDHLGTCAIWTYRAAAGGPLKERPE